MTAADVRRRPGQLHLRLAVGEAERPVQPDRVVLRVGDDHQRVRPCVQRGLARMVHQRTGQPPAARVRVRLDVLVAANPVAVGKQLAPDLHDAVLADALAAAEREGISGHDTTPFLLDQMHRATGGASLDVNVEVYRGNVAVGASIARALATLRTVAR